MLFGFTGHSCDAKFGAGNPGGAGEALDRIFHVFHVKYPPERLRRVRRGGLAQDSPSGASKGLS